MCIIIRETIETKTKKVSVILETKLIGNTIIFCWFHFFKASRHQFSLDTLSVNIEARPYRSKISELFVSLAGNITKYSRISYRAV